MITELLIETKCYFALLVLFLSSNSDINTFTTSLSKQVINFYVIGLLSKSARSSSNAMDACLALSSNDFCGVRIDEWNYNSSYSGLNGSKYTVGLGKYSNRFI